MAIERSSLTQALPDVSNSLTAQEARLKMEEERKKKEEEELKRLRESQGKEQDEDEEEADPSKTVKNSTQPQPADDDDMDEETEMQYWQALDARASEVPAENAGRKRKVALGEGVPTIAAKHPRSEGRVGRVAAPRAVVVNEAPVSPVRVAPSLAAAVQPMMNPPNPGDGRRGDETQPSEDTWDHDTWTKCSTFSAEKTLLDVFKIPDILAKETQKAKWSSEVGKIKPWVELMERVLTPAETSAAARVKDSEIKTALKQLKGCNGKVDKRLEYPKEKEVAGHPTFSARAQSLHKVLQACKDIKDLALTCGRSGSFSVQNLELSIELISTTMQKLLDGSSDPFTIALPSHWVQAHSGWGKWWFSLLWYVVIILIALLVSVHSLMSLMCDCDSVTFIMRRVPCVCEWLCVSLLSAVCTFDRLAL